MKKHDTVVALIAIKIQQFNVARKSGRLLEALELEREITRLKKQIERN